MKERDVYASIYDITKKNFKHPEAFLSKEAYLFDVERDYRYTDIEDLSKLENMDFLLMAYRCFFSRFPSEAAIEAYKEKLSLPKEEFQKEVLESLSKSTEYKIQNPKIYHLGHLRSSLSLGTLVAKVAPSLKGAYQNVRYVALPDKWKEKVKKWVRW
ncbi:MAG: hypothetical protein IJ875_00410 [Solobacterium sp.]|nr:hypothetical protein [Solobacterium sp.]